MRQRHRWLIGALVVVALAGLALIAPGEEGAIAEGGIIYVDADAPAGGGGTSWGDAYADLQDALEAAGTGIQIWVAEGNYTPTSGTDRTASFQMKNGVEIYGGFAGTEESIDDRDWVTNETILSGDLNGDDGPDFANNGENSYHVLYNPGGLSMDDTAVLDGFTITGGNANYLEEWPHFYGGGMLNYASSPMLRNCTFEGNSSAYMGGGMANGWYSSPTLANCTFSGNSAVGTGGGIANWDYSSPMLTECTFEGNSANDGGGIRNEYWASPTLTGCVFKGNSATERGGGMYNWYESSPTLLNCTFWANAAIAGGGGMYNNSSSPILTNCTFEDNSAVYGGGAIHNYNSEPTVTNSVLWGDSPEEIANSDLFSSPLVTYSNVQGGYPGDGNIFVSPLFVDAGGGDFHLGPGSPCVDAGSNTAPYLPLYDFEGDDRVLDGDGDEIAVADMGVDETVYEPPPPPPDVIFVDADAMGANTGTSWADAFTTLQPALSWAEEGVEIWVAEGVYKPTWEFSPGDARSASFQMKNGVGIYGGFDPTLGDDTWEERNWASNLTILSGDLGLEDHPLDNSYHVFYHPSGIGLNDSAVLDGFTISGGYADGYESPYYYGGGMYNIGSSPRLANCTFLDNTTMTGDGGGMYNRDGSSPTLTNCAFLGNGALFGGGMANYASSPTLTNCTFVGNWAQYGGGISNSYGSPVLTNCILWGNSPDQTSGYGLVVTYSDVQGGYGGEGNISADPLFADGANGDFHLGAESPCIDVGNNSAPYLPEVDFEGDARILDGDGNGTEIVDMGVDEAYYEAPPPPPAVIFVDADATGANTGTSWTDAFTTLQPALSWAVEGVEIWVAEGIYKPTSGTDRTASFQMKNGVALYGGFDPSAGVTEFEQRAWMSYETILSGDIGTEGDDSDNSYHVFYHPAGTDLDGTAILDGFTITGGNANGGEYADRFGAGMYNDGSSPVLANCIFLANSAEDSGAGMWNTNGSSPALTDCTFEENLAGWGGGMVNYSSSSPTLTGCTFEGNSALQNGGGMWNYDNSSPLLSDCTFSGNSAVGGGGMYNQSSMPTLTSCTFSDNTAVRGGGIQNEGSSPTLTGCAFEGNMAGWDGGGMYNRDASSPMLTDCAFDGNAAGWGGGGMYNTSNSHPTLTDCVFQGNSAGMQGGGMFSDTSSPLLANCAFWGNLADYGGGMYNIAHSSPVLTNCTFAGNWADSVGGAIYNYYESSPVLTNCILWGDTSPEIGSGYASAPVVTYSDVQGGYEGENNIAADPLFVNTANGDFHLGADSPCIDMGNNLAPDLPAHDFEGDLRVLDGDGNGTSIVDMGVDEFVYTGPIVVEVEIDIKPGGEQNTINLGSEGLLPVAILTTEAFDASTVRPASVILARADAVRWTMEDIDRDGDEDLLLYFGIQELKLDENSTEAILTGETFPRFGGVQIEGTDSVRIVP